MRKLILLVVLIALTGGGLLAWQASSATTGKAGANQSIELLNVSYDPTRELWRSLNEVFIADYEKTTGKKLAIRQSHAGSSSQARSVIDGNDADVVTLALWNDIDAIRKAGLIQEGWEKRLPNNSLPYTSTIVFVVRKGNPKGIQTWKDLVGSDVKVITPSPKTSGNGKLSLLAAWGSVVLQGGSEDEARKFVRDLYQHVPVLDSGARAATTTFAQKGIGDVHLTWENEAHFEIQEAGGALEIVYPPISIRAEPPLAVVDANAKRKGTLEAAEQYLRFVYTPEAQEIIAKNFYRPSDENVLVRHKESFPTLRLFTVGDLGLTWATAQDKFFAEGAVYDQIYAPPAK